MKLILLNNKINEMNNKLLKNAILLILVFSIALVSFKSQEPKKKFKFEFEEAQLNLIWSVIDQSNAPHLNVEEAKRIINEQYKKQVEQEKK